MQFKELKEGYSVYLFDRSNLSVDTCKVISVSAPRLDAHFGATDMFIDVTIEQGGTNKVYCLKDSTETGVAGQQVISTNRDAIIREVEAMKSQSEQAVAKVDEHKSIIEKCSNLLAEFNPIYKERKETEERFNRLESSIDALSIMIKNLTKVKSDAR